MCWGCLPARSAAEGGCNGQHQRLDNRSPAWIEGDRGSQRALDLFSIRGDGDLSVARFDDEHLVWWPAPEGLVIRLVPLAPAKIDVPPATLRVTDASGREKPGQPEKPLDWHESYRYFRLSQTSDDLFNAYRNAYLALESVLSSITPQKFKPSGAPAEGEGDWFKRALRGADKVVALSTLVPPGTTDPVQHPYDELYRDMRSAMSHAKSGRKVLLP